MLHTYIHTYTYIHIHTYVHMYVHTLPYICTYVLNFHLCSEILWSLWQFILPIWWMCISLVLCIPGRTDCPPHSGCQRSNVHDEIPDWTVQPWPRCIYPGRRCVNHVTTMWPSCDHHVTIMWTLCDCIHLVEAHSYVRQAWPTKVFLSRMHSINTYTGWNMYNAGCLDTEVFLNS